MACQYYDYTSDLCQNNLWYKMLFLSSHIFYYVMVYAYHVANVGPLGVIYTMSLPVCTLDSDKRDIQRIRF